MVFFLRTSLTFGFENKCLKNDRSEYRERPDILLGCKYDKRRVIGNTLVLSLRQWKRSRTTLRTFSQTGLR